MGLGEVAGKGALLTVAVSAITAGVDLVKENPIGGAACLAVGLILIVLWVRLLERQLLKSMRGG
ncbi:MAG: hypothetical protein QXM08_00555 [Thermofilaceae archaeon]